MLARMLLSTALLLGSFAHAIPPSHERDAWTRRREACRDFLCSHPTIIDASRTLRNIAANPKPAFDPPSATFTLGRQDRWRSLDDKASLPATVEDTQLHIDRVLAGDFDADPHTDSLEHGLSSTVQRAAAWTAQMRGSNVPALRESIADTVIEVFTSPALLAITEQAFTLYATDFVHRHCALRQGGYPHAAAAAACTLAFCMTDEYLCADLVVGMAADYVEAVGIWKPKEKIPDATLDFLTVRNLALIDKLERSPCSETDATAYEKTLTEVEEGAMEGPFTYDALDTRFEGHFLLHNRFGVPQNDAVRPCDDGTASGFNAAVHMFESLRLIAADWPARMARAFADYLPHDGSWDLWLSTDDVGKAFRQVTCAQPWYTSVAIKNPHTGEVEFFTMGGFNFGLASAPNQFNRITHHMTLIAQHLFAAACGYYYDDVPCLDPGFAMGPLETRGDDTFGEEAQRAHPHHYHLFGTHRGSSQWCVGLVAFLLGFPFSQKKRVKPSRAAKFLGVISDFTLFASTGSVRMFVAKERRAKIAEAIRKVLRAGSISGAAASRLAGKLSWATGWTAWRFGRAVIQPLFEASKRAGSFTASAALTGALTFFLSTLPLLPDHVIRIFYPRGTPPCRRVYLWTDACWEAASLLRPAGLGIVLLVPAHYDEAGKYHRHQWFYAEANCPADFIARFCLPRKQRIGELELLAAVCAYLTFADQLRGCKVIHWIDNTGALAALIKGYAKAADLAKIVHAFAATNIGLQCEPWFEYVRSKANIADFPSRGDFAMLARLKAIRVEFVLPQASWWDKPTVFLEAAVQATQRQRESAAKRSHALPADVEQGRRTRRRGDRSNRPRIPIVFRAGGNRAEPHVTGEVVDVDITRAGPFGNPFLLGRFDSNGMRRRECVVLYKRWLDARPPLAAADMDYGDGQPLPSSAEPRSDYWRSRTATDVMSAFERLARDNPDAAAFRLICSPSCTDRLCHGDVLAPELRSFLCADCA